MCNGVAATDELHVVQAAASSPPPPLTPQSTIGELLAAYLDDSEFVRKLKPATVYKNRKNEKHLALIAGETVAGLGRKQIRAWHRDLAKTRTGALADRAVELLRAALSVDGGRFGDLCERANLLGGRPPCLPRLRPDLQSGFAPRSSPARPSRPGINGGVSLFVSEAVKAGGQGRRAGASPGVALDAPGHDGVRVGMRCADERGSCQTRRWVRESTCGYKQQHRASRLAKPLACKNGKQRRAGERGPGPYWVGPTSVGQVTLLTRPVRASRRVHTGRRASVGCGALHLFQRGREVVISAWIASRKIAGSSPSRPEPKIPISFSQWRALALALHELETERAERACRLYTDEWRRFGAVSATRAATALLLCGARVSEIRQAAVDRWRPERAQLLVGVGKGGPQLVTFGPDVGGPWMTRQASAAAQFGNAIFPSPILPGRPVGYQAVWETLHLACGRAGIRNVSCHNTRATAATVGLELGLPDTDIQAFLCHRKLETTRIYTQLAQSPAQRKVAQALEGCRTDHAPDITAMLMGGGR